MGEIIPNIYSAIVLEKEAYKEKFVVNLKQKTIFSRKEEIFDNEGQKTFEFLQKFFAGYQKTVKDTGLPLPTFLKDGIKAVEDAYCDVLQQSQQQQMRRSRFSDKPPYKKVKLQQQEGAPVYEQQHHNIEKQPARGRAYSWEEKVIKDEQQSKKQQRSVSK